MTVTTPALLGGEYPTSWKGVIGQKQAKDQLITAARSAKKRKVALPHTLLASGQPGIGKTTLAQLVAMEMGTTLKVASGPIKLTDARLLFSKMKDGDILFIDEIHRMVQAGKGNAEWLLHYMQDGVLMLPSGPEKCPKVTILAATTDAGKLPRTVIDRFEVQPSLTGYTVAEAAKIAATMAERIFEPEGLPIPPADNCKAIARAASCNPRVIRQVLITCRDIALVHNRRNFDGNRYDLAETLTWLGLSPDGLTDTCRRYLVVMLEDFGGDSVGSNALQDRLQEPGGLQFTEYLLMEKGLIVKGKNGRLLTQAGIVRAGELVDEGVTV